MRAVRVASVAFDLDGTLYDSVREITAHLRAALAAVAPTAPFDPARVRVGPPLAEIVEAVAPGLDLQRRERVAARFRAAYDRCGFADTALYDGASAVIDALLSRGVSCHVVTHKRVAAAMSLVNRDLGGRVGLVACADGVWPDEDTRPEGKAAALRWVAARAGVDVGALWMVGDSPGDIAAAREAGARSVAAAWGYGERESLRAAGPDVWCESVGELWRWATGEGTESRSR